ncbi:MAG TPA: sugar transferase [Gaiellaceae bacterium]|nr:sugar transferase [Gaiellaceae bacterium]
MTTTSYPIAFHGEAAERAGALRQRWIRPRRLLLLADIAALLLAFEIRELADGVPAAAGLGRVLAFAPATFVWVALAAAAGLYSRDRRRMSHSTVDELADLVKTLTLGAWLVFPMTWLFGIAKPDPRGLVVFWAAAVGLTAVGRATARAASARAEPVAERTLIVGAGDVGQLVGRKLLQHPEYRLQLVGFVDANPRDRRSELADVAVLGRLDELPRLIRDLSVERVIVAFSSEPHEDLLNAIRALRSLPVRVDVVPRLFELVSPGVELHEVEGLPLVGLATAPISSAEVAVKRALDIIGSSLLLVLSSPLFAYAAWCIKRDSPGPVFFRQTRLGGGMREFTLLKFRTMTDGVRDDAHRAFIKQTMSASSSVGTNGLYKLENESRVTRVGRWLRRSSLDELPQLLNVLRGDMSLVGPRPCIPYETENFAPHHFERFRMPAGITGLWQVTARARATFGEALDMDVAYVRGWSLGLDLRLLLKTPLQLLRGGTA